MYHLGNGKPGDSTLRDQFQQSCQAHGFARRILIISMLAFTKKDKKLPTMVTLPEF
jgi:hypothetical protein